MLRRFIPILSTAIASVLTMLTAEGQACTCNWNAVGVAWPLNGDVDVPRDAPIVVKARNLDGYVATLVADDGTEVALVERRRFDAGTATCEYGHFAFLGPSNPLQPDTLYVLTTRQKAPPEMYPDGQTGPFSESAVRFATGTRLRSNEAISASMELFAVRFGKVPQLLLEAHIHTDALQRLFVMGSGSNGVVTRVWDPLVENSLQISLGAVECADVVVADAMGRTVLEEQRCRPSKCTDVDRVGADTCGGELSPGLLWEDWQNITNGCYGFVDDAPADCSLAPPQQMRTVSTFWIFTVAILLWRVRDHFRGSR